VLFWLILRYGFDSFLQRRAAGTPAFGNGLWTFAAAIVMVCAYLSGAFAKIAWRFSQIPRGNVFSRFPTHDVRACVTWPSLSPLPAPVHAGPRALNPARVLTLPWPSYRLSRGDHSMPYARRMEL